ncbi:N-acetyltransferase family protein [Iodidimonas sp. SYSU 1G8]|uniref:GNAT family N-acetyltransferase n=1 Tax=Iodidimonas sp. SYSU 1G8 TaxID=3133967 RepID=UPI0031FEC0D0
MSTARRATEADLPAITEIYNYFVSNTVITFDTVPFRASDRQGWFRQFGASGPHQIFVAAGPANVIMGYAYSSGFRDKPAYDQTVEVAIYLAPHADEQGIGSTLYSALFGALERESAVHRAVAMIAQPNPGSVALHGKFGFRPVGELSEAGFKFGRYVDILMMERAFGG